MANGKPISNDHLYDKIDKMRLELKDDILRLEGKFDTLEAGRLTRLEGKYNDLALDFKVYERKTTDEGKVLTNKFVALGALGIILLTALINSLLSWLSKVLLK